MLPTPDIIREAARRAAACADRLRLPLRARTWRGGVGELPGGGTGSSLDFQDHRPYFPGDDPRHINWAAYARTGQHTLKLFREEVRPTVEILCDASPSMFLDEAKTRRCAELLHFAFESSIRVGATVTLRLFSGPHVKELQPEDLLSRRWDAVAADLPAATSGPDLGEVPLRAGSLRVLISDLLFPGDPVACLRPLARSRGSGIALAPFTHDEAMPDWSGACDFHDVESGRRESRQVDPSVLRRYREAYAAHFAGWKEAATRGAVTLARVPCAPPLDEALGGEAARSGAVEPTH